MNKTLGMLVIGSFCVITTAVYAADMSRYYERGPVPRSERKKESPSELYGETKDYVKEKASKAKKDVKKVAGKVKKRSKTKTTVKVERSKRRHRK